MRFPLFYTVACLLLALPARAQLPRCEGTLIQSGDGAPVRARLFFQPPDSLKIEVLDGAGTPTQTVVASGDTTQTYDTRFRRVAVLNANIAREWWRGAGLLSGGPLNFAFTGATGFVAAPGAGITRVRDRVLLGNDERRAYYVASKVRVRAFPARVQLAGNVRTDFDDGRNVLLRAAYALDGKFPLRADSDGDGVSFAYALKARTDAFPDGTFALPDVANGAIREDAALRSPSTYTDASPDEQWNHGLALWRAGGDAEGALALWKRAAGGKPTATAPHFAALDVLVATRATAGAVRELAALGPHLSEADLAWSALPVDDLRADRVAALRDARTATKSGEPDRTLALSLALRASGDIAGARGVWGELLSSDTPRAVGVKAAENMALSATPDEAATLGATITGDGETARLARVLLDLRAGKAATGTFAAGAFTAAPFQAAFARGLERAGRGEEAKPLWEALEKSSSLGVQNEARAHLIALAARAGDGGAALGAWSRWSTSLAFDTQKANAQDILFDAFQKAGKVDALRVPLLNRARATGAKDSDLRLALAFQAAYGTREAIADAQSAGYARFPDVPFWAGKRAETLVAQAFLLAPSDTAGFNRRNALFRTANALLDKAIAGADDATFYTLQKALVQIQRATGIGGVLDPTEMANADDGARATLARLDGNPDPDFAAVAAIGWNALPAPEDRQKALGEARRALDSAPDDGDRATLVFAARQVWARVLDGSGDPAGAARQWAILLDVARGADDEAGVVAALLNGADRRQDAMTSAQLLVRVAGERWPLDANAALLSGAAGRAAGSSMMPAISKNLDALAGAGDAGNATKAAIVARAALALARLDLASAQIAVPGAPPAADAELERATRAQSPALAALKPLADGDDPFWAMRARLLLLDARTLSPDARRDLLQKLVATQGGEPSLALSLANGDADPKARARAAQTLDFAVETWRRLALDALAGGDKAGADFWSGEAFRFAQTAPEVDADGFQSIAWARAKVLWAGGKTDEATALYTQLSGASWNPIARAAALLGLRKRLQEAGRTGDVQAVEARIKAIGLDKEGAQSAIALAGDLDG